MPFSIIAQKKFKKWAFRIRGVQQDLIFITKCQAKLQARWQNNYDISWPLFDKALSES